MTKKEKDLVLERIERLKDELEIVKEAIKFNLKYYNDYIILSTTDLQDLDYLKEKKETYYLNYYLYTLEAQALSDLIKKLQERFGV